MRTLKETDMTRLAYKIAAVAAVIAVSANVVAAANTTRKPKASQTLQKVKPSILQYAVKFDCKAQGTPVEFPNDLVVVNKGPGSISAGTKINWRMENSFTQGSYVLPALAPNQQAFISNANPGGLPAGTKCFAWIVK